MSMKYKRINIFLLLVFLTILISCDKDFKEIQKASRISLTATSEAENFTLKHTDSARIKSILKSPLVYDYSSVEFPFTEFPNGVDITMFDANARESYITADYAITFAKSDIIELQKNVKVTSHSGDVLETSQLYYDQSREWIFTERDCKLTNANGTYYVKGFDAKSDLSLVGARKFTGSGTFSEN